MASNKKSIQENAKDNSEPTPEEQALVAKYYDPGKQTERVKVTKVDGVAQVTLTHPNLHVGGARLMEAIGANDPDFLLGLLSQLNNATMLDGIPDENALNFALSIVKGIEERGQVLAMLGAQMAAIHRHVMAYAGLVCNAGNTEQRESAERALNRLTRTFVMQMEALQRYRNPEAENKVTVQNVSVQDGGQAIVGNVTHSSKEKASDKRAISPKALSDAKAVPMPILDSTEPEVVRFRPKSLT